MRVDNWPLVLAEKINEWSQRRFSWAGADCCQFAADVVQAIRGTDYRDQFPDYSSMKEAQEILTQFGGVEGIATEALGQPKAVALAHRGDVVACDFGDGVALGICLGAVCCAPGQNGLEYRPVSTAVSAWSV